MKRSSHSLKVSNEGLVHVFCLDTEISGPTVVLAGGVHGDEYTGVELGYRVIESWASELMSGRIVCYPCLNPAGSACSERALPEQGGDLNRCFPGGERGARASRYAHTVWQDIISWEPDFVFDVHADSSRSLPYVIVDRPVLRAEAERLTMMRDLIDSARSLGCTVLLEYEERDYQRYGLQHSLAGSLVNFAGIPALTFEAGGRGLVDSGAIDAAEVAFKALLAQFGMMQAAPAADKTPQRLWLRSTTRPVRSAGMFVPALAPGERYRAGQLLANIRQLDGQVNEQVTAASDGLVIAWRDIGWVKPGAVVGTLGEVVPDGQT